MNIFTRDEKLLEAGGLPFRMGSDAYWYERVNGEYVTSRIHVPTLQRYIGLFGDEPTPFVIDLETFDKELDAGVVSDKAITQLSTVVSAWKRAVPSRPIGFYRILQHSNYWAPVMAQRKYAKWDAAAWVEADRLMSLWQRANDTLADLLWNWVDFVCPQLYANYSGRDAEWRVFAHYNIIEAQRIARGKPCYVMLMPCYHPSVGSQPDMTTETWSMMMDFVAAQRAVVGVFIYAPQNEEHCARQWRKVVEKYIRPVRFAVGVAEEDPSE